MSKERILIVEDDADIREGVRILLESEDYMVDEAEDGREGLENLRDDTDLVILDIMMPGISGLRTCEEIRKISNVPVLFLTAKVQESDKLIGLMAGGDDYLTKPFSYAELLGRNETSEGQEDNYIKIGNIRINRNYNEVFVDGKEKEFSELEYRILLLLMEHPRKIFSAQNIYESVWNEPYFYSCNGTVMVHIRKLRVKIEKNPQNPRYITTIWGKGYKFDARYS